jgi:hypothetical protein
MLERVDRIQMAVADTAEAARAFGDLLGAEPAREEYGEYLNARRTILTLGDSEVELCAPRGAGIIRAHLDRWDGLWIHPSALGGLLLGVSRSTAALGMVRAARAGRPLRRMP